MPALWKTVRGSWFLARPGGEERFMAAVSTPNATLPSGSVLSLNLALSVKPLFWWFRIIREAVLRRSAFGKSVIIRDELS